MLSSTERPRKSRDCWYVRASPSRARRRAGSRVTFRPKSSILPDVGGMSPEMTLKSVVFPAPFGPRIARRSPGATSRSTSRTAWRPPKRRPTPRKRRIGSALSAAACVTYLMTPLTTGFSFPAHGSDAFLHGGCVRPGGGDEREKTPPKVWLTFGMNWTVLTTVWPGLAMIWYDHSPSTAWRLLSSLTRPNGVLSVTFASAAWSAFWFGVILPCTACRPFTSPHAAL